MTPAPETDQAGADPASWDPVEEIVRAMEKFSGLDASKRDPRTYGVVAEWIAPTIQRIREEERAAERQRLEPLIHDAARAAVIAVEPLEAMNIVGPKGVAPRLWVGIQDGITAVRALVTRPEIAAIRARTEDGK